MQIDWNSSFLPSLGKPMATRRTLRLPAVAAATRRQFNPTSHQSGPMAYPVAKSLLQDESVSAQVRADNSFKLRDRAGHIAPTRKEAAPQKALSEMSGDELARFIESNQAEIHNIDGELAARAKDISPDSPYA